MMNIETFKSKNCICLDEEHGQAYVPGMACVDLDEYYLTTIDAARAEYGKDPKRLEEAMGRIEAMMEYDSVLWTELYDDYMAALRGC